MADNKSPASKGFQADLNAAANIGLRAITDFHCLGRWWYVPCSSKDYKPYAKKEVKGSKAFENIATLMIEPGDAEKPKAAGEKRRGDKKEIVNLWRDPACSHSKGGWRLHAEYWNETKTRVMERLLRERGW